MRATSEECMEQIHERVLTIVELNEFLKHNDVSLSSFPQCLWSEMLEFADVACAERLVEAFREIALLCGEEASRLSMVDRDNTGC